MAHLPPNAIGLMDLPVFEVRIDRGDWNGPGRLERGAPVALPWPPKASFKARRSSTAIEEAG